MYKNIISRIVEMQREKERERRKRAFLLYIVLHFLFIYKNSYLIISSHLCQFRAFIN